MVLFLGVGSMVLMHIYGDNDNSEKFIPFVIRSILNNEKQINLTSGIQKKDFIFIDDLCMLFISLMHKAFSWNSGFYEYIVGSGQATSIKDVVEIIKNNIHESNTVLNFGELDYTEADVNSVIHADLDVLKVAFNWQPCTTIYDGLKKTINHYRQLYEKQES